MERYINKVPAMSANDLYSAIAKSSFVDRYYALCRRFPIRDLPLCHISNGHVKEMLSELGLHAQRDARDNSFTCDRILKLATAHYGFVIQKQATVEFWFWLQQHDRRLGSNFAVIAFEAAKLAGSPLPDPQYPRPEFYSVDELRQILTECFDLTNTLVSLLNHEALSSSDCSE
jgi:hypothetical protein